MISTVELRRPFHHDGGFAYIADLVEVPSDHLPLLLENGRSIGKPKAIHVDIRQRGKGQYSIWNGSIYFSASDGSDCNTNDRNYQVAWVSKMDLREIAVQEYQQDDEIILSLIAGNTRHNNRFFANFFQYFDSIYAILNRNNVPLPTAILEIGSGIRPYTALRFLFEGTRHYIANDLYPIENNVTAEFGNALRPALLAINPRLWQHFDRVLKRDGDVYSISGLMTKGEQSFDTLGDIGELDFVHSTSALEHVMDPEKIAAKLAAVVKSGGHMYHSIDFRDHRDFNRPFDFLTLLDREYNPIRTENRLRSSDWIALFGQNQFDIIERMDYAPAASGELKLYKDGEAIVPFVDEDMRSGFAPPFRKKTLADLSILCTQLLCRKR
jgi:SAM-dependent methyltransferase